jgi:hypothetical protein
MSASLARWPAAALVDALRGRTVVDAYCDGEGMDDVHLRLDDGTRVWVDVGVEDASIDLPDGDQLDLGPRGRLRVSVEGPTACRSHAAPRHRPSL